MRLAVDGLPLVHLRLLLTSGGHHASADAPGLPSFTAALLDEGTSRRTGIELAAKIERLGGYLATDRASRSSRKKQLASRSSTVPEQLRPRSGSGMSASPGRTLATSRPPC